MACFVIATRARRRGVATALLRSVVDWAGEQEIAALEGYPVDTEGQKRAGGYLWHGTVSLFEAAGFEVSPGTVIRRRPPDAPSSAGRSDLSRGVRD